MHHLFDLLPVLNFPYYFSFSDIGKQEADDPSEKEHIEI